MGPAALRMSWVPVTSPTGQQSMEMRWKACKIQKRHRRSWINGTTEGPTLARVLRRAERRTALIRCQVTLGRTERRTPSRVSSRRPAGLVRGPGNGPRSAATPARPRQGPESVQVVPASRRGRRPSLDGLHCSATPGPDNGRLPCASGAAYRLSYAAALAVRRRGGTSASGAHLRCHRPRPPPRPVARTALATFRVLATLGTVVVRSRVVAGAIGRARPAAASAPSEAGRRPATACRAVRSRQVRPGPSGLTAGTSSTASIRLPPMSLRTSEMRSRPSLAGSRRRRRREVVVFTTVLKRSPIRASAGWRSRRCRPPPAPITVASRQ